MNYQFHECVVPADLKADHLRRGGRSLRRFLAEIEDGELRVMSGYEPFNDDGRYLLHVSVSVGKAFNIKPFRRTTDEELQAVKARWPHVAFEEDNVDTKSPFIRQLWQV